MKEILELIATYGLPIVLTVWFVFRIDTGMTKLIDLIKHFIEWQTQKDTDRKDKEKELHDTMKSLTEQTSETINRIKILEVKIDK